MSDYDDDYVPQVTGHQTERGFAFTVEVRPPNQDDIAEALARRMVNEYSTSTALKAAVSQRFYELIRETVDTAAKAAIDDAMNAPRQRTDEFGNAIGEAKTFAQIIGEQVKAWQDETVDTYDGKLKKPDAYGNKDRIVTRTEYLIRQVGAAEFEKLAKEEVAKIRTEAKARIDATIKASVAAAISTLAAK